MVEGVLECEQVVAEHENDVFHKRSVSNSWVRCYNPSHMEILSFFLGIALIHQLGLMSPGPDFIMAVRNSLTYSRRVGIFTAIGLGLGVMVHIAYCMAGLALVISQSIMLFNTVKLLGGLYLIYIGLKSFFSRSSHIDLSIYPEHKKSLSDWKAVRVGFLTNVLNPKATLYFLGLFTFAISPDLSWKVSFGLGIMMVLMTMIWFSLVAYFFTQKPVRSMFERFQNFFNKTFGVLLVAFGLKVALSKD